MHSVFAALVAVAMVTTSGSAAWQHVHAYEDHEHADHHHGPAVHRHPSVGHGDSAAARPHRPDAHASDSHAPDDTARLEDCDPGEHVVSVVFTYVAHHTDRAAAPVTLETTLVALPAQAWRRVTPSDVRAHSPPRLTDAPLRAPPVVPPRLTT